MSEPGSRPDGGMTKVRVTRPEYETYSAEMPNGVTPIPVVEPKRPVFAMIPSEPPKDPADRLVEAAQTVFRAITAEIARHEKAAQRLREALAPFASMARQSAAHEVPGERGTLEALLRIADQLKDGEQP